MRLTQSSHSLEAELLKLAKFVHCRYHDRREQLLSRVDTWKVAFPLGAGNTEPSLSVEKRIEKALGKVSVTCIGKTRELRPCQNKMGGRKVQHCTKSIEEIIKPKVYSVDASLERFLPILSA